MTLWAAYAFCLMVATSSWALAAAQCPWEKNNTELASASCRCSYLHSRLSVHCSSVNASHVLRALQEHSATDPLPIELLHLTNCTDGQPFVLPDDAFYGLRLTSIHFGSCGLQGISELAFRDLEGSLQGLYLPDNLLSEAPLAIRRLRALASLDLTHNRLGQLQDESFRGAPLDTLSLAANRDLRLSAGTFLSLAETLKNLNLKDVGFTEIPPPIQALDGLAFLDLAGNAITDLGEGFFAANRALTALSLEGNKLESLAPNAFLGLETTMTSLSLLGNRFKEMPVKAISTLRDLRVLDLGFNQISNIPDDSFANITSLTLLALDGNPLATLPQAPFKHLRSKLKGLSVGGRSFVCDCNVRWIAEWVQADDLQVTSREREPQFCGHPASQRNKNLYLLRPTQLTCPETTTATAITTSLPSTTTSTTTPIPPTTTSTTTTTTAPPTSTPTTSSTTTTPTNTTVTIATTSTSPVTTEALSSDNYESIATAEPTLEESTIPSFLVLGNQRTARRESWDSAIHIVEARREGSTVVLSWDLTSPAAVPGFRVVYRSFGDSTFKEGAILPLRVRRFRMTNVPPSECLVVCVVGLVGSGGGGGAVDGGGRRNLTVDGVPLANCREMRGNGQDGRQQEAGSEVDKVVIVGASAAVCIAVLVAVIAFACCSRRNNSRRRQREKGTPPPPPIVTLPPLVVDPAGPNGKVDWDAASHYSARSIPRARMYHVGGGGGGSRMGTVNSAFLPDDVRSQLSIAHRPPSVMADGSQLGYPNGGPPPVYHANTLPNPYPLGRPDVNRSAKSLLPGQYHTNGGIPNGRKRRSQQRNRWPSSTSNAGSIHSMSGYDTENNNGNGGYFSTNPWTSSGDHSFESYPSHHVSQPYSKRDYT